MDTNGTTPLILVIDDDPTARQTIEALLVNEKYRFSFAQNGIEGLTLATATPPDVILLDIMMPGMDGYEVCRQIRADSHLREVPVIIISTLGDREARIEGLRAGADDYLSKPVDRAELRAKLHNIVRINRYRLLNEQRQRYEKLFQQSPDAIFITDSNGMIQDLNSSAVRLLRDPSESTVAGRDFKTLLLEEEWELDDFVTLLEAAESQTTLEASILQPNLDPIPVELHLAVIESGLQKSIQIIARDISERKLAEQQLQQSYDTLQQSLEETVAGWGRALELREYEAPGHTQSVIEMTVRTAELMGMNEEQIVHVRRGAALHDIGKLGIPDGILLKPGVLSEEEWAIMRKHPLYSYQMLSSIFFLLPATLIPLYHHERWDGSGYPQGLKGEDIPLEARIFAVVDVWLTLLADRPFRKAWKEEKVRNYMQQQAGILFDPHVVDVFLSQVVNNIPTERDAQD